jgi:uncharacterized protein YkwD
MSHRIVRHAAKALTAAVVAGSALLATTGPAMAAEPAGLPMAPMAGAFSQSDITAIIAKHNAYRDEVKVGHLSWDANLAAEAQRWAETLAAKGGKINSASHNDPTNADYHEGENLHQGPASEPLSATTTGWYAEKAAWEAEPDKTRYKGNDNFQHWGHYSQMVWSTTTRVGCGTAVGEDGRYTSCRYQAPGNIEGKQAYQPGGTAPTPPDTTPAGTVKDPKGVHPEDCAYNPGGRGGYNTYVDTLALKQMDWEQELADGINAYRTQKGLPALKYSKSLARPAMWTSLEAYNAKGFTQLDSHGMDAGARAHYCGGYSGYLGVGQYSSTSVAGAKWQKALDLWKKSPGVERWMSDPNMRYFAVGMAYGGDDVNRAPAYYTVMFGDH